MENTTWYIGTVSQIYHNALAMRLKEEVFSEEQSVVIDTGETKRLFLVNEDMVKNTLEENNFSSGFKLYVKKANMESPIRINPKDAETFYSGISKEEKNNSKNLTLKMQKRKNDDFFALGKRKEAVIILQTAKKNRFVPVYKLEEKYEESKMNASYLRGKDRDLWQLLAEDWALKLETKGKKMYISVLNKTKTPG